MVVECVEIEGFIVGGGAPAAHRSCQRSQSTHSEISDASSIRTKCVSSPTTSFLLNRLCVYCNL